MKIYATNVFMAMAFVVNGPFVSTEIFRSVVKLELLAQLETHLLQMLDIHIRTLDQDEPEEQYIRSFYEKAQQKNAQFTSPHYLENPINTYHFVKHIYRDWQMLIDTVNCTECLMTSSQRQFLAVFDEDVANILAMEGVTLGPVKDLLPTESDNMGVIMSLVRLWQTYNLDLTDLFSGKILDPETDPLELSEVLEMCRLLDNFAEYYKAIKWFEELRYYIRSSACTSSDVTYSMVTSELASSYAKFGLPWVSVRLIEEELQHDPENAGLTSDLLYYKEWLTKLFEGDFPRQLLPSNEDLARGHYEALCRGDITRPVAVTSRFLCRLRHTDIPILLIKEEVMNWDPPVSLFYDVITSREQQYLKRIVIPMLSTSMTFISHEQQTVKYNIIRLSETAWIHDADPVIRGISQRVERTTGLSTKLVEIELDGDAEHLQVLNYGIGGMFEKHLDVFGDMVDIQTPEFTPEQMATWRQNRLATWMFYFLSYFYSQRTIHIEKAGILLSRAGPELNDVKAGGATVFTQLNITVPVTKGAAVFWYGFKNNGETDHRTEHAGCPVLLGSKWVANKWIRNQGQTYRARCGRTFYANHQHYEQNWFGR